MNQKRVNASINFDLFQALLIDTTPIVSYSDWILIELNWHFLWHIDNKMTIKQFTMP